MVTVLGPKLTMHPKEGWPLAPLNGYMLYVDGEDMGVVVIGNREYGWVAKDVVTGNRQGSGKTRKAAAESAIAYSPSTIDSSTS